MKYCPDCGCENIDEAQFCRNCGLKFDGEAAKAQRSVSKVENTPQKAASNDINLIVAKLFYKTDRVTGELRLAKAKTISIGMFVFMFLFGIFNGSPGTSFGIVFFAAIIFGLVFAIPVYVLGYIVGLLIERISN